MKDMNTKPVAAAVGPLDVAVVVMLCIFVLMTAGAMYRGGSMKAKTLMCTVNMQKVGQGMSVYSDVSDGRMPSMNLYTENGKWKSENCIRTHFVYSQWNSTVTPNQEWMLFGCLFKAGMISDGRTFYCPATSGAMDEYNSYNNPAPWGSNLQLQPANIPGTGNIWLRVIKGYIYWPQGSQMVLSGFLNPYDGKPLGYPNNNNGYGRYQIGKPAPPLKFADLGLNYAYAVDGESQKDDSGGYRVNALFGDGHVKYQFVPRYTEPATGKRLWICSYQGSRPVNSDPKEWYKNGDNTVWDAVTIICNYMYALEQ
jgi:prepilin-type processing-associated H-X9-DG protein